MAELETEPEDSERFVGPDAVRALIWVHPEERCVALSEGKVSFGRDEACTVRLGGPVGSPGTELEFAL